VVAAAWWIVLVIAVLAEAFVIGLALGLPGFSAWLAMGAIGKALLAAAVSFLLVPPVAWITVVGRGYMPPLGFAIATLALGNLFSKTGWAEWFPWSIVPAMIGMVGKPVGALPVGSYVVIAATFVVGVAAAIVQLRSADNAQ
jgi:ABC-2 type transport system permease protein